VENPAEYFLGFSAEVSLGNPLHEFASEYLPRSEWSEKVVADDHGLSVRASQTIEMEKPQ
jgi:hypothetical protein